MSKPKQKLKKITLRMDNVLLDQLKRIAIDAGVSRTQVINVFLAAYIKRNS